MAFRSRTLAIFLAATLAIGLLAAPGAQAKRRNVSSQVTVFSLGPNGVAGTVLSGPKACRSHREVTLYHLETIVGQPGGRPIANTATLKSGSWSIATLLYSGQYFVGVAASHTGRFNCRGAVSPTQLF